MSFLFGGWGGGWKCSVEITDGVETPCFKRVQHNHFRLEIIQTEVLPVINPRNRNIFQLLTESKNGILKAWQTCPVRNLIFKFGKYTATASGVAKLCSQNK